jgi:hypothetical protein
MTKQKETSEEEVRYEHYSYTCLKMSEGISVEWLS